MATAFGRGIRIVAGIALLIIGLVVLDCAIGWAIAVIGAGLIALGATNRCVIAPFLGAPFSGREAQARQERATSQPRSPAGS